MARITTRDGKTLDLGTSVLGSSRQSIIANSDDEGGPIGVPTKRKRGNATALPTSRPAKKTSRGTRSGKIQKQSPPKEAAMRDARKPPPKYPSNVGQAEATADDATTTPADDVTENVTDETAELQHVEKLLTQQLELNVENRTRISKLDHIISSAKRGTKISLSATNEQLKKETKALKDTVDYEKDRREDLKKDVASMLRLNKAVKKQCALLKSLEVDMAEATDDNHKEMITEAIDGTVKEIEELRTELKEKQALVTEQVADDVDEDAYEDQDEDGQMKPTQYGVPELCNCIPRR